MMQRPPVPDEVKEVICKTEIYIDSLLKSRDSRKHVIEHHRRHLFTVRMKILGASFFTASGEGGARGKLSQLLPTGRPWVHQGDQRLRALARKAASLQYGALKHRFHSFQHGHEWYGNAVLCFRTCVGGVNKFSEASGGIAIPDIDIILLTFAFLVIALVYAAVGQAGASGYIAAMAFAGFTPLAMKTTALALNLLVASITTLLFLKAGRISWRNIWPFAVLGFPFSLLGGTIQLPEQIYYPMVGIVLVLSALQMARTALRGKPVISMTVVTPPFGAALITGAAIGFISGTTGTGGGVFLAPVILAMNWGSARQTAATTAVYNLVNSGAALIGAFAIWNHIPAVLPIWLVAVTAGGVVGAFIGSRYLPDHWVWAILAMLLLVSGVKLLW